MQLEAEVEGWSKPRLLNISTLQMPRVFYPRVRVNQIIVKRYTEQLLAGAKFPPIRVGILHNHWIVVDGWHRTNAHLKAGTLYIQGRTKEYTSEKDLFADAVRFNQDHGYSLNKSDRRRSIRVLKAFKFSVSEIQHLTSMSLVDVTRNFDSKKSEMLTVTGPGGKRIAMPFVRSATEQVRLRVTDAIVLTNTDEVFETVAVYANGKYVTVPIISSTDEIKEKLDDALKMARGSGLHELAMVLERALTMMTGTSQNNVMLKYAVPQTVSAAEANPKLWEGPCMKCGLPKEQCMCKPK